MHLSTNFGKEIREKKSPGTNGLRELQFWVETVKLIEDLTGGKKGSAMPFGGVIWAILLTVGVDGGGGQALRTAKLGEGK